MSIHNIFVEMIFNGPNAANATVSSKFCEGESFRIWNDAKAGRQFSNYSDVENRVLEEFRQIGVDFPRYLVNLSPDAYYNVPPAVQSGNICNTVFKSSAFVVSYTADDDFTVVKYIFSAQY